MSKLSLTYTAHFVQPFNVTYTLSYVPYAEFSFAFLSILNCKYFRLSMPYGVNFTKYYIRISKTVTLVI